MSENFVRKNAIKVYDDIYKEDKRDHHYPNENIVRLTKWFFGAKYGDKEKGKCLDYGCGSSENMQHLIRSGFDVWGTEIVEDAVNLCRRKLNSNEDFKNHYNVLLIKPEDKVLPFNDEFFDCVLCNQVIYFLGDIKKIDNLLKEFHRVCKSGGKLIITLASRYNDIYTNGSRIGEDIFKWHDLDVYIFKNKKEIRKLFKKYFIINEIGYFDNNYNSMRGHHWVLLLENK